MAVSFNILALAFLSALVIGGGVTAAFGPSMERSARMPRNFADTSGADPKAMTAEAQVTTPGPATNGVDLEAVAGGTEVPRPHQWAPEAADGIDEPLRAAFVQHLLPWVLIANEQVLAERAQLWKIRQTRNFDELPIEERLWLLDIAARYGVEPGDFAEMARRVDAVPASILLAVAAWSTGWDMADELGWQKLTRAAISAPSAAPGTPASRDLPDFQSPVDALLLYLSVVNTHPEFAAFRVARERLRHQGLPLRGPLLSAPLPRAPSGKLPRGTVIAELIKDERLDRFDHAVLAPATQD